MIALDDFTDEERASEALESRPGLWWERDAAPIQGDGRALTQHQTDCLIATELCRVKSLYEIAEELQTIVRPWLLLRHVIAKVLATRQRGGIHSDPLVRVIARRAFGDRDEAWHTQPICSCGHEAWLHPTREPVAQAQHRCESPDLAGECQCACSRERVYELTGPECSCPSAYAYSRWGVERARRTNVGGYSTHHDDCAKLKWYNDGGGLIAVAPDGITVKRDERGLTVFARNARLYSEDV